MGYRLAILAAAVALLFPVTASAATSFAVTTTFAGCSAASRELSCEVEVGFEPVTGAGRYTAVVGLLDGSTQAVEELVPGNTAISVPYRGNGTYLVTVTAWNQAPPTATGAGAVH